MQNTTLTYTGTWRHSHKRHRQNVAILPMTQTEKLEQR